MSGWMARPVSAVIVAWCLGSGAAGLLVVHGVGASIRGSLPKQSMRRCGSSVLQTLIPSDSPLFGHLEFRFPRLLSSG